MSRAWGAPARLWFVVVIIMFCGAATAQGARAYAAWRFPARSEPRVCCRTARVYILVHRHLPVAEPTPRLPLGDT